MKKTAEQYAIDLRTAYTQRTAIEPLRTEIGIDDLAFAYEIQNANTSIRS